jgi:hypothetical protein
MAALVAANDGNLGRISRFFRLDDAHLHQVIPTTAILLES